MDPDTGGLDFSGLRTKHFEERIRIGTACGGASVQNPDAEPDSYDPKFLGLPDPDPIVRGADPDPSIIKQKKP
jgi:hypothetical protein